MNTKLTKNSSRTIGGVCTLIVFREIYINYGYEEDMKQILAKRVQQTLQRERQPNLTSAIAQSASQ